MKGSLIYKSYSSNMAENNSGCFTAICNYVATFVCFTFLNKHETSFSDLPTQIFNAKSKQQVFK